MASCVSKISKRGRGILNGGCPESCKSKLSEGFLLVLRNQRAPTARSSSSTKIAHTRPTTPSRIRPLSRFYCSLGHGGSLPSLATSRNNSSSHLRSSAFSTRIHPWYGGSNTAEIDLEPFTRTVPKSRRKKQKASEDEQEQGQFFPVSAIHISPTINIGRLYTQTSTLFSDHMHKQSFGKNSIIVQLSDTTFIAVFSFGSVVGVNLHPHTMHTYVREIKKFSTDPVLSGLERKENFGVVIVPEPHEFGEETQTSDGGNGEITNERTSPVVTGHYCVVHELDMNNVAVISNIMAQTVALDTYADVVDDLLAKFERINSSVAKSGEFKKSDKNYLFKTVAQNNSIFIDMISKVRIKDRSDTAWNLVKYEKIHYGMKEEFEIDDRFDHIEFKLNLIQQNAKFFLEVLQSQNSNSLEWIIVWLIGIECVIMCVDMSGLGPSVFGKLTELLAVAP